MAGRPARITGRLLVALGVAVTLIGAGSATPADAAAAPVGLGTAETFAVLAGSTVTNTGPSVISGDVGVSPGTAITGFPPATVTNGAIHVADAVAAQAQLDAATAYDDAAGRSPTASVTADLGGQTLVSGVYSGPTLGLTGTVILDAQGDPDAVFIFQAGSTLITETTSVVALANGAQACNVFWQIGSSATLGSSSTFVGTLLALTSVTANTGAAVSGRLLARNAAVTVDSNTITRPACAVAPTTTVTSSGTNTTQLGAGPSTTALAAADRSSGGSGATAGGAGSDDGRGTTSGPTGGAEPPGSGGPNLPVTGSGLGMITVGLASVALGAAMLVASRRQCV